MISKESSDVSDLDKNIHFYILREGGKINRGAIVNICDSLINGEIVVGDFYSTYGIMFLDSAREKVARAKGESIDKPVSVVARISEALNWIDLSRIHPRFTQDKIIKLANSLKDIGFLRFPSNDRGRNVSKYGVSNGGYLQVLFKEDNDPILKELQKRGIEGYLVTSLNPHGELERYQPHLAFSFAKDIGAKIFFLSARSNLLKFIYNPDTYDDQFDTRKRKGSVPILLLPGKEDENPYTGDPIIRIVRSANTHPYSIERAIKEIFPCSPVRYDPDKPEVSGRPQYSIPSSCSKSLWKTLYQASMPKK